EAIDGHCPREAQADVPVLDTDPKSANRAGVTQRCQCRSGLRDRLGESPLEALAEQIGIKVVNQYEIDAGKSKSLAAAGEGAMNCAGAVVEFRRTDPSNFGRQDELIAGARRQRLAEPSLTGSSPVQRRGVEVTQPGVPARIEKRWPCVVDRATECTAPADAQAGNLETSATYWSA